MCEWIISGAMCDFFVCSSPSPLIEGEATGPPKVKVGTAEPRDTTPGRASKPPPPEVVMLGSGCADQLGPTRWHLNWSTYRRMCLVRVAVVPVFTATGTGRRFGTGAVESSRRNRGGPGEVDSKTPPFWTTFDLETWDTEGIRKQGPSYTYTNLRARYFWLEGPHRRRLL